MSLAPSRETLAAARPFGPVVQLAWHAPDIEAAAARWAAEGAGPFYLLSHIEVGACLYRGRPARFEHSSAYGQAGDLMLELIQQHGDAPSAVRDLYDQYTDGWHHAAVFAPNLDGALEEAALRGYETALDATTKEGVRFVMVDARADCGLMLELYEPTPPLLKFYAYIKRKAEGWSGENPLRVL